MKHTHSLLVVANLALLSYVFVTKVLGQQPTPFGGPAQPYPWSRPSEAKEFQELVFKSQDGVVRMRVGLLPKRGGAPGIEMFDAKGKRRMSLGLDGEGAPSIELNEPNGGPVLMLETTEAGLPQIQMADFNSTHQTAWTKVSLGLVLDKSKEKQTTRGHLGVYADGGVVLFDTPAK